MKYVVDLGGCGYAFCETIRNLGLGVTEPYDLREIQSRQKYIYNESASQIALIVDADMRVFLTELQKLPNPTYFEHIDKFIDPRVAEMFINAFKEFGLRLYAQISTKIGIQLHCDYLLEAIAEDYMVVCVVNKTRGTPL